MRLANEQGFTLIELMAAMAVLGILSSIAVQQYNSYQTRVFDIRAEHDLRVALTAEEAYFAENESYVECANASCDTDLGHFVRSAGVDLTFEVDDLGTSIVAEASHPQGAKRFLYDSSSGLIREVDA